jgi:lysosomal-associated membrane protein 1/2
VLSTNTYEVTKDNATCILVVMEAQVSKGDTVVNITKDYVVDTEKSTCTDTTATLVVAFNSNTIQMNFASDNKTFSLVDASVNVGGLSGHVNGSDGSINVEAAMGASYKCKATLKFTDAATNVTLETMNLQVQAFKFGTTSKFDTALVCAYDIGNNIVIPVAVGCALGGLIIIIIIAYFIGRRKVKHHYEAM